MDIEQLLKQIRDFICNKSLTKSEKRRLEQNLVAVYNRLEKRDYQKYSYSTNKFDIPERARDLFIDMQFYSLLGRTWAVILKELGINKFNKVADLCPGYIPKVELGLYYLGFKGEVVVIDQDSKSLFQLEKYINIFNFKFKLTKKTLNIFGNFKESYDLVLGNHIIDDLTLYFFSKKEGVALDKVYGQEKTAVNIWQSILKDKNKSLNEILPVLTSLFLRIVKIGGFVCLSHYKSYTEKLLNLNSASKFNQELFRKLILELERNGFIQRKETVKKAFKNFHGHFGPMECVLLFRAR